MIAGIGVDCTSVARMAKSRQNARFVQRVFSNEEQALMEKRGAKRADECAAACFAAKEAFLKATGRGLGGFSLRDIAALREASGKPYYALSGAAAAYCVQNGLIAHLSITHEAGLATAFAVLEKAP